MKLKKLELESYLTIIKNSVGTRMFRSFYVTNGQKKFDLYRNGELSCAFFVSCVLTIFQLINAPHATVKTTLQKMIQKGWQKRSNKNYHPGDVLLWEAVNYEGGSKHTHLGFYLGHEQAISHRHEKRMPIKHDYQYNGKRKIITAYYWPGFNQAKLKTQKIK